MEASVINIDRFPKKIETLGKYVHQRYWHFVREHNDAQVIGLSAKLRTPHQKVFEAVMYKYTPVFRKLVNSPLWADSDIIPSVSLTRREIGNLVGCESRNVYNILVRLCHAGVLTVTYGQNNSYEISPNLWFLLGDEKVGKPKIRVFEMLESELPPPPTRQSLPDLTNKEEILNNQFIGKQVENLPEGILGRHEGIHSGREQTETCGEIIPNSEVESLGNSERISEEIKQEAPAASEGVEKSRRAEQLRSRFVGGAAPEKIWQVGPAEKALEEREKVGFVEQFWKYVRTVLYPKYTFGATIEEKIKQVIREDVFGSFNGSGSYVFWKSHLLMRQAEVDMLQIHNDKYGLDPFFPTSYFKREYASRGGFLQAHEWTKREKRKFKDLKQEELLERAIKSTAFMQVPRGMKDKIGGYQDLAQYWAKRLSKCTNASIVARYYQFLTTYKPK